MTSHRSTSIARPVASLIAAAGLAITAGLLAACESEPETFANPAMVTPISPTLPLDPTQEIELSRWWTNGEELLRLDEEGSFGLYPSLNRYDTPELRGVWSQPTFASVALEPYDRLGSERIRCQLERRQEGGPLSLDVPNRATFRPIDQPPRVPEDDLVGRWADDVGVLVLWSDGTYRYSATKSASADQAAPVSGHPGQWKLANAHLLLSPLPPQMEVIVLNVDRPESGAGRALLRWDGRTMEHDAPPFD